MIRTFLISVCLALILPAFAERFIACHDGDTCTLEDGQRVRLSGLDAPELGQPYSEASRDYLIHLVVKQEATLDCNGRSYGRRVCNVSVLGVDVQKELVSRGLAFDYTQYSKGLYAMDETFARVTHRGVWQLPDGGVRPWNYRHRQRACGNPEKGTICHRP